MLTGVLQTVDGFVKHNKLLRHKSTTRVSLGYVLVSISDLTNARSVSKCPSVPPSLAAVAERTRMDATFEVEVKAWNYGIPSFC